MPLLPGLLWSRVVISVKGPIYGINRYLYSADLRLYPFMEKAMEVNPEYKSGVESLRRLDVSGGFLLTTPAAKLIPNVLPCIFLDPISEAERGGCVVWATHSLHIPLPRLALWRGHSSLTFTGASTTQKTAYRQHTGYKSLLNWRRAGCHRLSSSVGGTIVSHWSTIARLKLCSPRPIRC